MSHQFVSCRRCGWVYIAATASVTADPSASETASYCRCGAPATTEWMAPSDGADVPIGATVTSIVLTDEPLPDLFEQRQAAQRLRPVVNISLRGFVEAYLDGRAQNPRAYAATSLAVLTERDRGFATKLLVEAVDGLHAFNCIAYGIPHDLADRFQDAWQARSR